MNKNYNSIFSILLFNLNELFDLKRFHCCLNEFCIYLILFTKLTF